MTDPNDVYDALTKALNALNAKIDAIGQNQSKILDILMQKINAMPGEVYISAYEKHKIRDDVGQYIETIPHFSTTAACIPGGKGARLLLLSNVIEWARPAPGDIILEFGVWRGESLSLLSQKTNAKVYGFDSFTGMPQDEHFYKKGQFNNPDGVVYPLRDNAELVKGWFEDTIPPFMEQHDVSKAKIVHIDCDIYSSTVQILQIADKLKPGTFIVFDEYWNWPGWRDGEFKAWHEYIERSGRTYEYAGYIDGYQQVAIKLLT